MAIAIRSGAPSTTWTTSNPVSVTLSGAIQPQAGDLLVIYHANDFYAASNMPTPTVGGSSSGVNAITNGSADAGTNQAHVKTYTYVVGSTGNLTVSVTETGATPDEEKMLICWVLSGADTASPIDGGSAGAAGSFSATNQTTWTLTGVTPTNANSLLLLHANSGGGVTLGSFTPPSSPYVEDYDAQPDAFFNWTGGHEPLASSGATGTRALVASAGSAPWAGVILTIKAAAGGGQLVSVPTFLRPVQAPLQIIR